MTFEEYAAQHAQEPQQAQQAQEPQNVEQAAEVEKLSSLMAQLQADIDAGATPAAMLEQLTGALFGSSSPQAAAVAAIIEADKNPGGHELAIASIRQRRALLRRQAKQLEEQAKTIAAELAKLDESERALTRERSEAEALDSSLIDTLTFCKSLDAPDMINQIEKLYNQHRNSPAAMGLLYGSIMEKLRQHGAGSVVAQYELTRIIEGIENAIKQA